MYYKKKVNDFPKALGLSKDQINRLDNAIAKAYEQDFHKNEANPDQVNAFVAPYIKSQEEAFYVATTLMMQIMQAYQSLGKLTL